MSRERTLGTDATVVILEGVALGVRVKVNRKVLVLDGDSIVVSDLFILQVSIPR